MDTKSFHILPQLAFSPVTLSFLSLRSSNMRNFVRYAILSLTSPVILSLIDQLPLLQPVAWLTRTCAILLLQFCQPWKQATKEVPLAFSKNFPVTQQNRVHQPSKPGATTLRRYKHFIRQIVNSLFKYTLHLRPK